VGFNMSWVFVDQVDLKELYVALDVQSTGEPADPYDLGTGRVPLAGLRTEDGWCAVFGHYAFALDMAIGVDPLRLVRLPAKSRAVICLVLEHANISYSSLWQDGREIWQVRHQPGENEPNRLDFSGDLPPDFLRTWEGALHKQGESDAIRKPDDLGVDHIFDVPLDAAAKITGYRHDRGGTEDTYREVTTLEPINGNELRRLGKPPKWWQTVGSTKYFNEGDQRRESDQPDAEFMKKFMEVLKQLKARNEP
jgi:hypothetical protein